jgi:cell division septation protein DedD
MSRTTAFQIPLRAEELRPPIFAGAAATPLAEPMQAIVTAVLRRAAEAPFSIYLCADDDSSRARDDFALALARALAAHIPSALVVDCDFLHPGLGGLVPQKDALGFLDYMLYGSSIGVIMQDNDRVHFVGAGSFPVTKRMPFIESAFTDAARRLVAHARCVVFVGPVFDGDGGRHPLTGAVDVVATVRTVPRDARLDAVEEHVAAGGPEVWSIRLGDAALPAAPVLPPAATPERVPAAAPFSRSVTAAAGPLPEPERPPSSLAPRIAVIAFGLLVIAFVTWWFLQDRELPGLTGQGEVAPGAGAPDTLRRAADTPVVRDTTSAAPRRADTTTQAKPVEARPETAASTQPAPRLSEPERTSPTNPADTGGRTGGTPLVKSEDIQLMEDLERRFNGWFMIHISSFQTSVRAREEVAFLQSREYPAFIVFLDLGPKGKWYRVYAGPFATREEAREVKKNLDAIPQVRFTRIASIPD